MYPFHPRQIILFWFVPLFSHGNEKLHLAFENDISHKLLWDVPHITLWNPYDFLHSWEMSSRSVRKWSFAPTSIFPLGCMFPNQWAYYHWKLMRYFQTPLCYALRHEVNELEKQTGLIYYKFWEFFLAVKCFCFWKSFWEETWKSPALRISPWMIFFFFMVGYRHWTGLEYPIMSSKLEIKL